MKFVNIDIEKLFELMQEHNIAEVKLRNRKTLIEVKRNREDGLVVPNINKNIASTNLKMGENRKEKEDIEPINEKSFVQEQEGKNTFFVEAPLVGTFYKAAAPDSDPFVDVGDKVKRGDVLCIVEAMKSMNEIQSEVSGVIKEVCINNAELVEFGQVLFKIDTSA